MQVALPDQWIQAKTGDKLWTKQQEIIRSVAVNPRTAVASCNGAGKCIEANERIPLADGRMVKAADLIGRYFAVMTYCEDGKQKPQLAWATDNGTKPVYRVRTETGREIIRTGNHPLLAGALRNYRGLKPEMKGWQSIQELKQGDIVAIPLKHDSEGGRRQPDDHVKLLGYMLGDGGTTQRVVFTQQEGPAKDEFREIIIRLGAVPRDKDYITIEVAGKSGSSLEAGRNPVLNLMREWGLYGKRAKEKTFPDWAWEIPNDQLALLLNRLMSCDGWAYHRPPGTRGHNQIGISLASEKMVRDVEMAMLRLGIEGKTRPRTMKNRQGEFAAWEWAVYKAEEIKKFADLVGIYGKEEAVQACVKTAETVDTRRTQKWPYMGIPDGYRWDRIESIEYIGERPTVTISVEETHTFVTTMVEHNSYLAARVVVWFIKTFNPCVVVTTAPTHRQVRRILWKEIHSCYNHAKARGLELGGTLNTVDWQFDEEHYAFGFATRDYDATAFQGLHGPHMLVVVDEAAGISQSIWEGIYSCLRGSHSRLLAIGNPTAIDGDFFNAFQSDRWNTFHISAFDTPNLQGQGAVVPGLVTEEDVANAREDWGEGSPLWVARIDGKFPDVMENTLITMSMVDRAGNDDWDPLYMASIDPNEPEEIGADLARYGSDESVFVCRRGILAHDSESFGAKDLGSTGIMYAAGRLKNFILKHYNINKPPMKVKCDAVGLGGGVPDRLRELQKMGDLPAKLDIIDMNAGAKPNNDKKYFQADAEWYDGLALRFKNDAAIGPVFRQKKVVGQLAGRKYTVLSDGRYKLESKEEIRKRGGKSPDWADAIAMAFAPVNGPIKKTPTPVGVGSSYWNRRS